MVCRVLDKAIGALVIVTRCRRGIVFANGMADMAGAVPLKSFVALMKHFETSDQGACNWE